MFNGSESFAHRFYLSLLLDQIFFLIALGIACCPHLMPSAVRFLIFSIDVNFFLDCIHLCHSNLCAVAFQFVDLQFQNVFWS